MQIARQITLDSTEKSRLTPSLAKPIYNPETILKLFELLICGDIHNNPSSLHKNEAKITTL
jgi:hypothetical protein